MHFQATEQELAEIIAAVIVHGTNVFLRAVTFALSFYLAYGPYSLIESVAAAAFVVTMGWSSHCAVDQLTSSSAVRVALVSVGITFAVLLTLASSTYSIIGSVLIAICVTVLSVMRLSIGPAHEADRASAALTRTQKEREEFINGLSESTKDAFRRAQLRRDIRRDPVSAAAALTRTQKQELKQFLLALVSETPETFNGLIGAASPDADATSPDADVASLDADVASLDADVASLDADVASPDEDATSPDEDATSPDEDASDSEKWVKA